MSKKFWGPDKPIKSQKEWDTVFESQAKVIAETLKITMDQARVRQLALLKSGILDQGDPTDPTMQRIIDMFLSNPAWDNQPKYFGESLN
jgi:hypothetical protein